MAYKTSNTNFGRWGSNGLPWADTLPTGCCLSTAGEGAGSVAASREGRAGQSLHMGLCRTHACLLRLWSSYVSDGVTIIHLSCDYNHVLSSRSLLANVCTWGWPWRPPTQCTTEYIKEKPLPMVVTTQARGHRSSLTGLGRSICYLSSVIQHWQGNRTYSIKVTADS